MKTIQIILQLLANRNIKAAQLTKDGVLTNGLITQWKKGLQEPSLNNLTKLSDYFEVPIDLFLQNGIFEYLDILTAELRASIIETITYNHYVEDESCLNISDNLEFLLKLHSLGITIFPFQNGSDFFVQCLSGNDTTKFDDNFLKLLHDDVRLYKLLRNAVILPDNDLDELLQISEYKKARYTEKQSSDDD